MIDPYEYNVKYFWGGQYGWYRIHPPAYAIKFGYFVYQWQFHFWKFKYYGEVRIITDLMKFRKK